MHFVMYDVEVKVLHNVTPLVAAANNGFNSPLLSTIRNKKLYIILDVQH